MSPRRGWFAYAETGVFAIGERGKSMDETDASLVEWFLSRNANFVSRRGRRMRRSTHRFSCVWPPGCLFFAHEGNGCSRISFRQLMIRIKLMRHALCLCPSGVVALLPTNYTNGHESFVNGFYGLHGYTSLNLSSLAIRVDASNATHENL